MSTTKELKSAAEELIEVLGLVDDKKKPIIITKKTTDEEMVNLIKEAAAEVLPDDEISDETRTVIDELMSSPKKKAVPAPAPAKGKKVVIPEPEEDDEDVDNDDAEADDENATLVAEIEDAEKLKDLKAIIADNDIFKASAKKLNAIKDVDDLRDEMLELIQVQTADTDVENDEEEEEEVVVEVKAKGKKAVPAPAPAPAAKGKKAVTVVKEEKPVKEKKAAPVKKEKKEKGLSRQDAVLAAIKALCKKGATLKAIMEYGDNLYVENGGTTNPTATNVNSYSLQALIAFDVMTLKDGIYKLNK